MEKNFCHAVNLTLIRLGTTNMVNLSKGQKKLRSERYPLSLINIAENNPQEYEMSKNGKK